MITTLNRPAWAPRTRSWAWGASVLAHGAALAWLLHALPPRQAAPDVPAPALRFVLVAPLAPAPVPVPAARPEPVAEAIATSARRRAAAPAAPARRAVPPDTRPDTRPKTRQDTRQNARQNARQDTRPDAQAAAQPIAMPAGRPDPAFTVAAPDDANGGNGRGFDMAAARSAARAATAGGGGPAGGQRLRETRDEKLGRAIDGARNGDCQTQYAGMGLFALIPLAKDTLTGTGCKWK